MNLSQTRSALAHARVRPVKSLGQNFLHDQNLAQWIVEQAKVSADDFILEIGPGVGALTEAILHRGARMLALEKDRRLVEFLRQKFRDPRFRVLHCDALEFDERMLFAERNVKIIGNLPYYIASQILVRYIDYPSCISLAVLMLQEEMARRLCSRPGRSEYGALTLRLQLHHRIEYLRRVRRSVFIPQPEIASAIVRIVPRAEADLPVVDYELYRELVRRGFAQRRKELRNVLFDSPDVWPEIAEKIHASLNARAEELSREQWIALSNLLAKIAGSLWAAEQDEQFAVVDQQDRKIGTATRAQVHGNNLGHRAVHIFIFSSDGDLLLQRRSVWKDRHPLVWDSSAAGHVTANEGYDDTASRELQEELGVTCRLQLVGKIPASDKTDQEFVQLYCGRYDGPFTVNRLEISTVKFFPADLVQRWINSKPEEFAPGFLEAWKLWSSKR